MHKYPLVSFVIPARNEEKHIGDCLESILGNDYPSERLEILVIDGMSTDGTKAVVQGYSRDNNSVRLLENPKRIIPAALNIGIKEAKGEIVMRADAHASYASDYIRKCVALLQSTDAANVGGVLSPEGASYMSRAIGLGVTTPFGIGNAHYRYATREMWVDTVFPGAWWKSTLEEVGGFNEEWPVNQDYELNYRLRKMTGRGILLSPEVKCTYYVRPTLRGLFKQYFRYGFWRVKTLRTHPESLRWRQLVPPAFVLAFGISLGLFPVIGWPSLILPGLYLLLTLSISGKLALSKGARYLLVLPLIFPIIHVSWGTGFLYGLTRWGAPRMSLTTLFKAFTRPKDMSRDTVGDERS